MRLSNHNRRSETGDDSERGSASAEVVISALLLFMFLVLGVGIARLVEARALVDEAAMQAARAAALAPPTGAATSAARSALTQLANHQECPTPHIHTRYTPTTGAGGAGGSEAVEVSCAVPLSDLFLAGFPGHLTVTSTQTAPRNPYQQTA